MAGPARTRLSTANAPPLLALAGAAPVAAGVGRELRSGRRERRVQVPVLGWRPCRPAEACALRGGAARLARSVRPSEAPDDQAGVRTPGCAPPAQPRRRRVRDDAAGAGSPGHLWRRVPGRRRALGRLATAGTARWSEVPATPWH